MDNLKISHHVPAVVSEVIKSVSANYSRVGKLTVRRGKKHNYLGMALYFSEGGKCVFDIREFLDKIPSGLPEDMNGMATPPASNQLLKSGNN